MKHPKQQYVTSITTHTHPYTPKHCYRTSKDKRVILCKDVTQSSSLSVCITAIPLYNIQFCLYAYIALTPSHLILYSDSCYTPSHTSHSLNKDIYYYIPRPSIYIYSFVLYAVCHMEDTACTDREHIKKEPTIESNKENVCVKTGLGVQVGWMVVMRCLDIHSTYSDIGRHVPLYTHKNKKEKKNEKE